MIECGPASEDEMVLAFVQAEIDSPRFGWAYACWLAERGIARAELVDDGLPSDSRQNALRVEMLGATRGYQAKDRLFAGFPDGVTWRKVQVQYGELARFMYAREKSLLEASGGARLVADGAGNYKSGDVPRDFGQRVAGLVERIIKGERFHHLIAVEGEQAKLILVEGHTRATAYIVAELRDPITVLVGASPLMKQWIYF